MMMLPLILFSYLFFCFHVEADVTSSGIQFPITATPSNASFPLFTNTTSSNPAEFPYIIPYGQSQECDIYGPLCQTGSITVGVSLTGSNTSTVLPCSSYLTAQSSYLNASTMTALPFPPMDWGLNFGRSPECRSYAQEYISGRYTISGCGDQNTVISQTPPESGETDSDNYPPQLPLGLFQGFSPDYSGLCCGNCSLDLSEVRLYYFPDSTIPDCKFNQTSNSSSILSGENLGKRVHSLVADGSTAVVSGYTFTSPSVYLQVLGTAAVSDGCNTVGPTLTSPIIPFPPGGLSTWKPPASLDDAPLATMDGVWGYAVGDIFWNPVKGADAVGITAPLNVNDLACPTWGLGIPSTSADGSLVTTVGPPWLPLIVQPTEAFSLNPTWSSICTAILTDSFMLNSVAIFDPPIALTPGSSLVPVVASKPVPAPNPADSTTAPENPAAPSTVTAKPASSPTDPADPPARTGDTGQDSPSPSLVSNDPLRPGSPPSDPVATPTSKSDPPAEPNVPQPIIPISAASEDPTVPPSDAGDPPSPPEVSTEGSGDPSNGQDDPSTNPKVSKPDATQTAPADPKAPAQPAPQHVDGSQTLAQGLGAIIYNAFGKSGPKVGGTPNEVNTISVPTAGVQQVSTGGGQILSVDSSGVKFQGKTYSIGGPAMTISNSVYTLIGQHGSGNNAANDDLNLGDSLPAAPDKLTIAGQTIVPNPTGFILNGAIISPGGAAQTVDGIIISLGPSGLLAIGSSTISLPTPSSPPFFPALTVAGQTFTPNPTAFSIAGTTISAGGSAVTLAGTVISLGQSGALAIGSTTISLSSPSITDAAIPALTVNGETFTPNPSAFFIAGTTISAGGPPVTIAGTAISLESSGTLIVGSRTISLLAPQTPPSSLVKIDGPSVEALSSSLAIVDGVTVGGNVVSLETGGATMDVGTGRFGMPTGVANGSAGLVAFEGGQRRGVEMSLLLLMVFGIGGTLMTLMG